METYRVKGKLIEDINGYLPKDISPKWNRTLSFILNSAVSEGDNILVSRTSNGSVYKLKVEVLEVEITPLPFPNPVTLLGWI